MKDINLEDGRKVTEENEKDWQLLPGFGVMVYLPEMTVPEVAPRPRLSSEERWKAIMAKAGM